MKKDSTNEWIYAPSVIDFVTVAVEFCAFLEKDEMPLRDEWVKTMIKYLPLLYVKATLLPEVLPMEDANPETFVREEDYTRVLNRVNALLDNDDIYLDVFVEDMKYSDTPISSSISEDIADIYQDVRNFISVYQYGMEESMLEALWVCIENFRAYWGQKLVNVLRPLHTLAYHPSDNDTTDDMSMEGDFWS